MILRKSCGIALVLAATSLHTAVASALPQEVSSRHLPALAGPALEVRHEGHHEQAEEEVEESENNTAPRPSSGGIMIHHGPIDMSQSAAAETEESSHADTSGHTHNHANAGPAHSHGAPKEHFDPNSIPPDPLSYLAKDLGSDDGHGFLMGSHIVLMSLSWMGFLPLTLYLRTAKHPLYHFAQLAFVVTTLLGLLASLLYKAQQSEDLYPHNSHAPVGWFSVLLAGALVAVDTANMLRAFAHWWKSGSTLRQLPQALFGATSSSSNSTTFSPRGSSYELVSPHAADDQEAGLTPVQEEQGDDDDSDDRHDFCRSPDALELNEDEDAVHQSGGGGGPNPRRTHRAEMSVDYVNGAPRSPFTSPTAAAAAAASGSGSGASSPPLVSPPARSNSRDSTDTLHDNERHVRWTTSGTTSGPSGPGSSKLLPAWFKARAHPSASFGRRPSKAATFFKYTHIFFLRALLPLGYGNLLLGLIIYTGKCRGKYVMGCAAHIIKGSIFIVWGLLSFARYLGAWSELGWAWNAKPKTDNWRRHMPSAEAIESFLIFFYGATNTFMERFGAKSGDPFNAHQVEHISIAILYFGAGSLALLMESQTIRRWLADGVRANQQLMTDDHRTSDPPSYATSFNPMPALVAALTGIAMGAHHQEYVYSVKIHQLWGAMLVAFAICRILTYAFLFLRPPASTLPSRPPTELLASFFCACGGFTFMVSTEQVSYAAMANGWDDVFMINNLCLAFIGLLMSWQAILTAVKGWATIRMSGYR